MSINYTPRTFVAGEVETAAIFNAEVRDAFVGIQAAWTAFTSTWTATTTNPVIGNGTNAGRWSRLGKTLNGLNITITMGSTTTFGSGTWLLTYPAALVASARLPLTGNAFDSSASADFAVFPITNTSTTVIVLKCLPGTAGVALASVGAASPMTWATSDILNVQYGAVELA